MKDAYLRNAETFAKTWNVTFKVKSDEFKPNPNWGDKNQVRHCYHCVLSRDGESYEFEFWASLAEPNKKPNIYDVLSTMVKDCPGTYENFCETYDFHYYSDAARAVPVYELCKVQYEELKKLFPERLCWEDFCHIQ